jgi:MHS family proline/betaine transporter-like MFS transporter
MTKNKKRKIISSAIVGNVVEYYDFGIYAVYASTIGRLFFASSGHFVQALAALSVFAIGFLMRPIGGIFFGHIGDIWGRKTALTISILGMAASSIAIGLLPSYEDIGVLAPVLLVIIRLFQGLCIGGEGAGSAIFIMEHLQGYKPGLMGSIVMASNMIGTLLANFMGIIIMKLIGDTDYNWRIGFLLGGLMGSIGIYMRTHLTETPQFAEVKKNNEVVKFPLLSVIQNSGLRLLLVGSLGGMTASVAYMIRGYFNTFFTDVLEYSKDMAMYFTSFSLWVMICSLPFFGILADRIGYRKFLYKISYLIIICVVPVFVMLTNDSHNIVYVMLALLLYGLLAAAICAPAYPYAISAFSPEYRYSGVAFSWNVGIALFGGTTAPIAHILSKYFGPVAPAFYIIFMVLAFIFVTALTRKDKH